MNRSKFLKHEGEEEFVLFVVEDEPDLLRDLIEFFESQQFIVYGLNNGESACRLSEEVVPDLIITDLIMEGLSGQSMLEKLGARPETRNIPVIVLSARVDSNVVNGCETFNVECFMTKPFRLAELLKIVRKILVSKRSTELL